MSSDLAYRDYSLEILQRPLPAIDAPQTEHIFPPEETVDAITATHMSSSGQHHHQASPSPSGPDEAMSDTARKELWKANVNSAISGNQLD